MKLIQFFSTILYTLLLMGCSLRDPAGIVNHTKNDVRIKIKFNKDFVNANMGSEFKHDVVEKNKYQGEAKNVVYGGDCLISYDSIQDTAVLILKPSYYLALHPIHFGDRTKFEEWDFSEIEVKGTNFYIQAKEEGIMNFVRLLKPWHNFFSGNRRFIFDIGSPNETD